MKTAFDIKKGQWDIAWPQRVSRYDIVYLSPPEDPMQGMPAGNGDIGILAWTQDSKIIIVVNKCDLWDNDVHDKFQNWSRNEEEFVTTLRHGYRIVIDFKLPVFEHNYLKDFNGRVSLADAKLIFEAESAFGKVCFDAFVDEDGIICGNIETDLSENIPVEINMERFGSRTFSHWYKLINRDASIGLDGTNAFVSDDTACISQELTSGIFVAGCRVVESDLEVAYKRSHSRCCTIDISQGLSSKIKKFGFISTILSPSPDVESAYDELKKKLDNAQRVGIESSCERHCEIWKDFWCKSFMDCGDDYIDNLWHLSMYYANCTQQGRYPGRFINGLWGWNRDSQPWNFYFHWNQQQIYWPLNAAGHHNLCKPYLEYRYNALLKNMNDAAVLHNCDGAFVSDVCERNGFNSYNEGHNYTPVAEIALDFWRQYEYTQDMNFLREMALPYLLEAAKFISNCFEQRSDGKYHAKLSTPYEGWLIVEVCVNVVSISRSLLSAAIKGIDICGYKENLLDRFKALLDNMAPVTLMDMDKRYYRSVSDSNALELNCGHFKGYSTKSDQILSLGYNPLSDCWQTACRNDEKQSDEAFPAAIYAPVFPSGNITLADKGTDLFDAAVNSALLQSPDCMGWDPLPIVLARLGLSKEFNAVIRHFLRWQIYINGWGHYGPWETAKPDSILRFKKNLVQDTTTSKIEGFDWSRYPQESPEFSFPAWPFRHFGMEFSGVLACAVNESLLQSHDGVIRVAAAVDDNQSARFSLHARGGLVVSAQINNGVVEWIYVSNVLCKDNTCRIFNPWEKVYLIYIADDNETWSATEVDEKIIEAQLCANSGVLLSSAKDIMNEWNVIKHEYKCNQKPKYANDSDVQLGLDRYF